MKIFSIILTLIFSIISTTALPYSGLFMPVVIVLSTALFIVLSLKSNIIYSIFSVAFSVVILYIISSSFTVATFLPVACFLSALGINIALKTKSNVKMTLLGGTSGYFLLVTAIYFIFGGSFVVDTVNTLRNIFFTSFADIASAMPNDISGDLASEVMQIYNLFFETLKIIAPAIILSAIFLLSYFSIKVSSHLIKDKSAYGNIPSFSALHSPIILGIITIISYLGQTIENPFISGLMSNLFFALSVYYTLCGFSLIDFLLKRKIKSLGGRIGIHIAIFLGLTLLSMFVYFLNPVLIAMFAGLMDSALNYRRRYDIPPENRA